MRLETRIISQDSDRAMDFMEILMRWDFIQAISQLQKKWEINPKIFAGRDQKGEEGMIKLLENDELRKDVKSILESLEISTTWEDLVLKHVVGYQLFPQTDKVQEITKNPRGLTLVRDPEDSDYLYLRVGPETTHYDFKKSWEEIKKMKGNQALRKRGRKHPIRDFEIFALSRENKTIKEIYTIIKNRFGKSSDLDFGHIKKIVSYFNTLLKIPKKERVKLRTK